MRWISLLFPVLGVACTASPAPPVNPPSTAQDVVDESSGPGPDAPTMAAPVPASPPVVPVPTPTSTPTASSSEVEVDVINGCSKTVDFCVQMGRSEKNTRLAGNAHERYQMSEGDRVRAMDGSRCGETLYEVTASPAKQKAKVCDD